MLELLKNKLKQAAEEVVLVAEKELEKIKLSEEDRNTRYDICKNCEWLFMPTNTCKKCGCFVAMKTYISSQYCPMGKWKSIPIINETKKEMKL